MQLNKPASVPAFDKYFRRIEPALEPVTIKAASVMALTSEGDRNSRRETNQNKISLPSCIMGSIKHLNELPGSTMKFEGA